VIDDDEILSAYAEALEDDPRLSPEAFAVARGATDAAARDALRRLFETHALFEDVVEPPRRVGPYRVLDVVGRGGVGVVFRAVRDDAPDDVVALKILAPTALVGPRAVERFRREARALRRVEHRGVVRVLEAGEAPEGAYVAMEFVEGTPLSESPAASAKEEARIAAALARAVAAAHDVGVVHRDLKPSNVVLRKDGSPVLLDFGLAHDGDASTLTRSGDVLGTPRYMAPEQARGEFGGPALDVYGLGAILHDRLAGVPPHGGTPPPRVVETIASRPAPPIRTFAPSIDPVLAAIVDRALEFDPSRRHASAALFAEDLEAWIDGRPTTTRPPSSIARLGRALRRRRKALFGVALLLVAAASGGLAVLRLSKPKADAAAYERASLRGWTAFVDGDFAAARDAAAEALRARPNAPDAALLVDVSAESLPTESPDPVWRAFLAGERELRNEDPNAALQHFEWAAARVPDFGVLHHRLGRVAAATDRPDLAVRAFDRAARALPESRVAALDLARALEKRKEWVEAAETYAAEAERTPDDGDVLYRLARARFYAGDAEGALQAASLALGRLGEDGVKAYVLYGVLLDGNGRRAEARAAYDAVLRRKPDHATALYNKGVSFDSEHMLEEAAAAYEEAARIDPSDARTAIVLSNLYSGASRDVCEGCRAAYGEKPRFLDFERAMVFAARALEASRGDPAVVDLATTVALRVGGASDLLPTIEALRAERAAESAPSPRAEKRRKASVDALDRASADLRRAIAEGRSTPPANR
jgi:tetratricopeptide (TPR) repeat protein